MIQESAYSLDLRLAEAITASFEALPDLIKEHMGGDFEPQNPIAAIIAQAMAKKLNPALEVTEVKRGLDGKFSTGEN